MVILSTMLLEKKEFKMLRDFTYFWPIFPFYILLRHKETFDFLLFSGSIKREHWPDVKNVKYLTLVTFFHPINILVRQNINSRSSRLKAFHKIGVLKNFTKFTRKHLRQSIFFNKVTG